MALVCQIQSTSLKLQISNLQISNPPQITQSCGASFWSTPPSRAKIANEARGCSHPYCFFEGAFGFISPDCAWGSRRGGWASLVDVIPQRGGWASLAYAIHVGAVGHLLIIVRHLSIDAGASLHTCGHLFIDGPASIYGWPHLFKDGPASIYRWPHLFIDGRIYL